jgi:hypothetical protein
MSTLENIGMEQLDRDVVPVWAQALLTRLSLMEQQLAQRPYQTETTPTQTSEESSYARSEPPPTKENGKKLPHPPAFEGQKSNFKPWLSQVYAKLAVDMKNDTGDV